MGEIGKRFVSLVKLQGQHQPAAQALAANLSTEALKWVLVRHVEVSFAAMDFWYNIMSSHFRQLAEEDDILGNFDVVGLTTASTVEDRSEERPLLKPYMEQLCATLLQVMQFPADLGGNFELDRFVNLRELCATVTTEALVVVEPAWMLDRLGEELRVRTTGGMRWQEVEACMHMLTAVAPRAEAGKDQVIPQMIFLIPNLPYPSEGEEMLLMRCAAARFVMYTVGYLSQNEEKTFPVVLFLAQQLLPSLFTQKACDLRQYCEALLCETLKITIGAQKQYLVKEDSAPLLAGLSAALMGS